MKRTYLSASSKRNAKESEQKRQIKVKLKRLKIDNFFTDASSAAGATSTTSSTRKKKSSENENK